MPEVLNEVSKIKGLDGTVYTIKDASARERISKLESFAASGVTYAGTTTTELSDGATTTPITIGEKTVTPTNGMMVNYAGVMYGWNGSQWDQLGSAGVMKALAYKDSVTGSVTPTGKVTGEAFTGEKATISAKTTPEGDVAITSEAVTDGETANYVPAGSLTDLKTEIQENTTTVNSITDVGQSPAWGVSVANETMEFTWNAGALPTKGEDTTVTTGVKSATTTGKFAGAGAVIKGAFTGHEATLSSDYTPAGTIDGAVFTGDEATIESK